MELDLKPAAAPAPPWRQFVAVRFKPGATKVYTYHNDGPPLAVGDRPAVDEARGDGWQRVEVAAIVDGPPDFPTKGIRIDLGVETGEA